MSCKSSRGESGVSKLTILVFGLIFGSAVYSIFEILPFYYSFYELEGQADAIAKGAWEYTDDEIRKRVLNVAKEYDIPAAPEDLTINRIDNRLQIVWDYEEEFYITFNGKDYTIRVFPFHLYVDRKFM